MFQLFFAIVKIMQFRLKVVIKTAKIVNFKVILRLKILVQKMLKKSFFIEDQERSGNILRSF